MLRTDLVKEDSAMDADDFEGLTEEEIQELSEFLDPEVRVHTTQYIIAWIWGWGWTIFTFCIFNN